MKYANFDGQRVEALSGGKGKCPICHTSVIAKCGVHRIHHWAHVGLKNCDSWKEHETQWHRDWKNKFPAEWQEYIQYDEVGEKHIADIRTQQELVIEFQHSHVEPREREARERFHKKIVWVVDGTRLKRDYPRFQEGAKGFKRTNKQGHYFVPNPEQCFSPMWLGSPVAVFFDFLGSGQLGPQDALRNPLWQLLPQRVEGNAVVVAMTREYFVQAASQAPQPPPVPVNHAIPQMVPSVRMDPRVLSELLRLSTPRPAWKPHRRHRRF